MSHREPFFEPLPAPATPEAPGERTYTDLPWQVPVNVVGVTVALRLGLARDHDANGSSRARNTAASRGTRS